jgi:putative acetyltransferase
MEFFAPARRLYAAAGFVPCAPFGAYVEDPNSVFMTSDSRLGDHAQHPGARRG